MSTDKKVKKHPQTASVRKMLKAGKSYAEIGRALGMTRQGVQNIARRAGIVSTRTAGRPAADKPRDAVHTAEVRVHEDVHAAAVARLDAISDERGLIGSSRHTLADLCRRLIVQPLQPEIFPQLPDPFVSSPPGSHGGPVQVVRWRTRWGDYMDARTAIHARGYSVSHVIETRLRFFALTGKYPPETNGMEIGSDRAGTAEVDGDANGAGSSPGSS